jgi:very-short-patch-repair endonuclease
MFMMRSQIRTYKQARRLRAHLSRPEVLPWVRLRGRTADAPTFRRQHPVGPYITDFCCSTTRLVVEIDGGVHNAPDRMLRDTEREAYLRDRGYRVLRLTNHEVLSDPDAAAERITTAARLPPPSGSA